MRAFIHLNGSRVNVAESANTAVIAPYKDDRFLMRNKGVAAGSPPGDGETWLRRLGVERPLTVRDVAAR